MRPKTKAAGAVAAPSPTVPVAPGGLGTGGKRGPHFPRHQACREGELLYFVGAELQEPRPHPHIGISGI